MAQSFGIETLVINRNYFYETEEILQVLNQKNTDFIVLAGFLWLIPDYLVNTYANRMVNIHPALLPKYGGKGMYGMNVHRAVKVAGEKESGITIHYVNAKYDEGNIIFQAACSLEETDSPEIIAQKVRTLEHQHFAPIIESLIIRH
jgi:phosphoribosylglycinamide formyltransferase-1